MQNFQDTFGTCKQSFISVFSICMTVPKNLRELFSIMNYQTFTNCVHSYDSAC